MGADYKMRCWKHTSKRYSTSLIKIRAELLMWIKWLCFSINYSSNWVWINKFLNNKASKQSGQLIRILTGMSIRINCSRLSRQWSINHSKSINSLITAHTEEAMAEVITSLPLKGIMVVTIHRPSMDTHHHLLIMAHPQCMAASLTTQILCTEVKAQCMAVRAMAIQTWTPICNLAKTKEIITFTKENEKQWCL